MAQAGGNDMANVKKAISLVENFLKELWYECLLYGSNYGT
jgi:hypothetical protein